MSISRASDPSGVPLPVKALLAVAAVALTWVLVASASAATRPVWLCKPGAANDPCNPGLSTTVFSPTLKKIGVQHPRQVKRPRIDCFYVYPTVSDQKTGNANLHVDPEERSIALYQAARYSQYCRVYAPMYRQLTLAGIGQGTPTTKANAALPLRDVHNAFEYYLKHFNHGRGFILIGHSQGSFVLRQMIAQDVDRRPAVRKRLISAILLGGNVLVKPGKRGAGGDFKHIPACRSARQLGCVIAFSTYDQPAPPNSLFGRTSESGATTGTKGDIVLCTNPAALAGGSGIVQPIFPSKPFAPGTTISLGIQILDLKQPTAPTVWVTVRNAYRAACVNSNGAHVLEIKALHGAQVAKPSPDPTWGLHLLDAQIALGNLVRIEKTQMTAYLRRH